MQLAVSTSTRGLLAAAALLVGANLAPGATAFAPMVTVEAPLVEYAAPVDVAWHHANHLAWAIQHRRYDELVATAARIDDASPYARWVPAALGLAVEQLDQTADAYARMGRCRELGQFLHTVERAWPAGRAAMTKHRCESSFMCGTYKSEMIELLGSAHAFRTMQRLEALQRYSERVLEIDLAVATGDHARALASCGEIGSDGPMLAVCLAEACRAGELSIAEVLLPHADTEARLACATAGVTFSADGLAYAIGAWRTHPADLVHVHPDAPHLRDGATTIIDW